VQARGTRTTRRCRLPGGLLLPRRLLSDPAPGGCPPNRSPASAGTSPPEAPPRATRSYRPHRPPPRHPAARRRFPGVRPGPRSSPTAPTRMAPHGPARARQRCRHAAIHRPIRALDDDSHLSNHFPCSSLAPVQPNLGRDVTVLAHPYRFVRVIPDSMLPIESKSVQRAIFWGGGGYLALRMRLRAHCARRASDLCDRPARPPCSPALLARPARPPQLGAASHLALVPLASYAFYASFVPCSPVLAGFRTYGSGVLTALPILYAHCAGRVGPVCRAGAAESRRGYPGLFGLPASPGFSGQPVWKMGHPISVCHWLSSWASLGPMT
jgi:hypothetical protein